jgi:hypothetical protein
MSLDFKAYDVVFLDIGMDAILRKRRKNGVKMEFPFVGGKRQVLLEDIIYIHIYRKPFSSVVVC